MKILFLPVVALVLVLSPVFAFQCENLEGQQKDLCIQIQQLNMTEQDKQMLYTLAFYNDRTVPNHDFIALWNQQLNFTTAPDGVSTQDKGVIKNAWLKIISVMPSVLENDTLYCDTTGKLQSAYNYNITLPDGTINGDCQTTYELSKDRTTFDSSVNGNKFGSDKLSTFSINETSDANFLAQLNIIIDTKINHYKNNRYCCKYSNHQCVKYCYRCEYYSNEIHTDSLTINDSVGAKVYDTDFKGNVEITDSNDASSRGKAITINSTRFTLNFQNSSYEKSNYIYDFNYSFQPYNILTLVAQPFAQETKNNIFINDKNESGFLFIVKNSQNCSLTIANHFSSSEISCDSNISNINLSVSTDKFYYASNDTIFVKLNPETIPLTVTYGNQSIIAQNTTSFVATYPDSTVTVRYGDKYADTFFSVTEQHSLVIASRIFLFSLLNYFLYSFLTKSHFISPWLIAD